MPRGPSTFRAYAIALAAVGLAAALRWGMSGILGTSLPYHFFFAAIMASAWFGGFRPGLFATLLSAVAATTASMAAPPAFDLTRVRDVVGVGTFVLIGAGISALCENLHRTRRRLSVTLQSIGDAVIVTDAQGRVRSLNRVAANLTGWSEDEAVGRPLPEVFRIVNERSREVVENPATRTLREGRITGLAAHTILIARDGTETPIGDSSAPVRDDDGIVVGGVLVFRDVTARHQSQRANALLAAVVESSDDAIISKTLDGTIVSWNAGAERLFGYTSSEAIGRPITLVIPEDRWEEETGIIERLGRGERVDHFETVRRTKGGRDIHVSLTISPIKDESGTIIGASKVVRDITERRKIDEERREADRRKDEFLATLAHELRNPLAPIRYATQILRLAGNDPGQRADALAMMDRQLEQMVRLIDDLLDVSRISRGKLEMRREPLDVADAVRLAVESSRPLVQASEQELVVHLPDRPAHVEADLQRLAQVFANLLNNASKFTAPGGRITLEVAERGREVAVTVGDSGVGIPKDKLRTIFDLFTQLDGTLEREQAGLGIGLTLGKRIVELHGGTIEARSEGEGRGSTFVVTLPTTTRRIAETGAAPAVAHRGEGKSILIVEDNRDGADSLAMLLGVDGHEIHIARDGQEALEVAARIRPDVVLLDIGLPKLNGYEVCRRIRQEPWGRSIAIFALTGWGQEEDRKRSDEAGFDGHLVKPVRYDDVMELLAR